MSDVTLAQATDDLTTLYRLYDGSGVLLYVGITGRALKRMYEHAESKSWWPQVVEIHVEHFDTRQQALTAEADAIKTLHPVYNKQHAKIGAPFILPRRLTADAVEEMVGWGALVANESDLRDFLGLAYARFGVDLTKGGTRLAEIAALALEARQIRRKIARNNRDDINAERVRNALRRKVNAVEDEIRTRLRAPGHHKTAGVDDAQ